MSDKRRRPVIGKLTTPRFRSDFLESGTSPTTPLEYKVLSPTGIISCDMSVIGLGIVAALENTPANKPDISCRNPVRSDPIPVSQTRTVSNRDCDSSFEEEYTIVTCHKPNKSFTKVYHGGHEIETREKGCIFSISPARFCVDDMRSCRSSGFLSSCYLCNKKLHGKDLYMYRGEKAFCSPECRSRQIAMDERPEKYCSSQVISVGANRQMSTGIFAI